MCIVPTRALFRLIDNQVVPLESLPVETGNCFLGCGFMRHFHQRFSLRFFQLDGCNLPEAFEKQAEFLFGDISD